MLAAKQFGHNHDAFFGGFMTGGFTTVFEEIVLLAAAGSVILYANIGSAQRVAGTTAIMLWSACGAMLMAGAANLMMIFLGLELLSLGLYALCAAADRRTARESALKYLILSSTATGFLLFGMALLFGATGSVRLSDLVMPMLAYNPIYWMGSGMFMIGLLFKLSMVPFHSWTPDVFEGAPLPVTAFMSVATKAATLAVFARFIYAALPLGVGDRLLIPVWIVAGISMIAGNVGMLAQTDLKRLLGYSGIAQVGYILVALAGEHAARIALRALLPDRVRADESRRFCGRRRRSRARAKRARRCAATAAWLSPSVARGRDDRLPARAGRAAADRGLPRKDPDSGLECRERLHLAGGAADRRYGHLALRLRQDHPGDVRAGRGARSRGPALRAARLGERRALCRGVVVMAFYPLTPSNILPLVR